MIRGNIRDATCLNPHRALINRLFFEDRLRSELTSALTDGGLAGAGHHWSRGANTGGSQAVRDSRRQSVMHNARANQSLF
jgi:hypothetical protein